MKSKPSLKYFAQAMDLANYHYAMARVSTRRWLSLTYQGQIAQALKILKEALATTPR